MPFHHRDIDTIRIHSLSDSYDRSIRTRRLLSYMRPISTALLRRACRAGSNISLPSWLRQPPKKHVKIDDEEQQASDLYSPSTSFTGPMKMLLLLLILLLLVVILLAYIIYKPPPFVINFLQWKYPDVLFHVPLPPTQKIVALTLDDAPSDETTKILESLKTYGAKATFFIIGSQVAAHPELIQRIHDEGHELGNHAWADEPSINLPLAELERQIKEVEGLLVANAGSSKYFRPGSGVFSKEMVKKVLSLGYRSVLGSVYPHDPQIHNAEVNAKHVLSMVQPGGIIIMHDRRSYSADQVDRVLKGLKDGGWKVESLGGLLAVGADLGGKKSD